MMIYHDIIYDLSDIIYLQTQVSQSQNKVSFFECAV